MSSDGAVMFSKKIEILSYRRVFEVKVRMASAFGCAVLDDTALGGA